MRKHKEKKKVVLHSHIDHKGDKMGYPHPEHIEHKNPTTQKAHTRTKLSKFFFPSKEETC